VFLLHYAINSFILGGGLEGGTAENFERSSHIKSSDNLPPVVVVSSIFLTTSMLAQKVNPVSHLHISPLGWIICVDLIVSYA
jgi:hypothetical protein